MQMASIALSNEMETEPCCEEHKDPSEEPTKPDVTQTPSERDSHTELPRPSAEEGSELLVRERAESETCEAERSEVTQIKSPSESESGGTEYKEQRKLRKTNSWKMVRFQDPSDDGDMLERDSSAESLFPEYAVKEWTSSTFEELFMAEDWQEVTGEETSVVMPNLTLN